MQNWQIEVRVYENSIINQPDQWLNRKHWSLIAEIHCEIKSYSCLQTGNQIQTLSPMIYVISLKSLTFNRHYVLETGQKEHLNNVIHSAK